MGPSKAMIAGIVGPPTTEQRENGLQLTNDEMHAQKLETHVEAARLKKLTLQSDIFHVEAPAARMAGLAARAHRRAEKTLADRQRQQERSFAALDTFLRRGTPNYQTRRWTPAGVPRPTG